MIYKKGELFLSTNPSIAKIWSVKSDEGIVLCVLLKSNVRFDSKPYKDVDDAILEAEKLIENWENYKLINK